MTPQQKFDLFTYVVNHHLTTKSEIAVLWAIIQLSNSKEGGAAWPSYEYLANRTQLSRCSAIRAVQGLVRDDILVLTGKSNGGKGITNRYVLNERKLAKLIKAEAVGNGRTGATITRPNGRTGATANGRTGATQLILPVRDSTSSALTRGERAPLRGGKKPARPELPKTPIQKRKLSLTEIKHMTRGTRLELNAELDELLEYMEPAYNAQHPDKPLDADATLTAENTWICGKDRGQLWGTYLYARAEYHFHTLRAIVWEHYANQPEIEHPTKWLMHRRWLPKELQPKVVHYPLGTRKQ